jgi:hypothetical protein
MGDHTNLCRTQGYAIYRGVSVARTTVGPSAAPLGRIPAPLVGAALAVIMAVLASAGCQTVDPGPNFVVSEEVFNEDYFYCHVEPELIFAKRCGSGDPAAGDAASGCHFNSSAVSGMALRDHEPIDCGGGDIPVNRARVGSGSPAQVNFQSVSLEMSRDYLTAPVLIRPTGANHPRVIFNRDDAVVNVIRTWADRP